MYLFPSRSMISNPSASLMNGGVPPTALNARTGELTPPGITFFARAKAASELATDRGVTSGMSGQSRKARASGQGAVRTGRESFATAELAPAGCVEPWALE